MLGYEGYYEVSNLGRVRALERIVLKSNGVLQVRHERIKSQTKDKDGYMTVGLNKNGIQKKVHVHSIVATAFVDGYFLGAEVNHIDFNRVNNNADNLEWVSHKDNINYSYSNSRHARRKNDMCGNGNPNYGNHKLSEKYKQNKELSIQKQSRRGDRNGRCVPIRVKMPDESVIRFGYISECAKYLIENSLVKSKKIPTVSVAISYAARNKTLYYNMTFELI